MSRTPKLRAILAGIALVASALPAQQLPETPVHPEATAPAKRPAQPRPLFHHPEANSASALIHLDLRVSDRSGKPVPNLHAPDFKLLLDHSPEPIVAFSAAPAGERSGSTEIVFVLDTINVPFETVAFLRHQLGVYLRRQGELLPEPMSIVIVTDTGTRMETAPTTDPRVLRAYLEQTDIGLPTIRRSSEAQDVERLNLSLRALNSIASYQAKRPGPKSILWIGPGWPMLRGIAHYNRKEGLGFYRFRAALFAALEQGRATVYAVDPTGTDNNGPWRRAYQAFLQPVTRPEDAVPATMALGVFATATGGRVVPATNDLAAEIEACIADAKGYYTLAFVEPPAPTPAIYHAVSVTVPASPGTVVRTRSGFYAFP